MKWLAASGEEVDGQEAFSLCSVKCSLWTGLPEGDGNLANYCSSPVALYVLSYGGKAKKEKAAAAAAAGRCLHRPLFGVWPAAGACFCDHSVRVGSRVGGCLTAAHLPAEVADRRSTGVSHHKIFRESCGSSFLFISSPDLYPSSLAERP